MSSKWMERLIAFWMTALILIGLALTTACVWSIFTGKVTGCA